MAMFRTRRVPMGALVLVVAPMVLIAAWPSCESHEATGPTDVDPGPTYGVEIALTIKGHGGVKSIPEALDCPGKCFASILLADPSVDGGDGGVTLVVSESPGAHFVGWTSDEIDLGVRAKGPSQCSPMTRRSATPQVDSTAGQITLPFGETTGTPPPGREVECAEFTRVPIGYSLTALFEEDPVEPLPEASVPDPGADVIFQSPGSGPAKEIGVTSGQVYWRYESGGLSGIATAFPGALPTVVVSPVDQITLFHVGVHVAIQHSNGLLQAISGGNTFAVTLGNAPTCAALASDVSNVYCRSSGALGSTIYSWPVSGAASPTIVHTLPPGRALGVDSQRFYFSDDKGGFTDQASIASAPLTGDGGVPLTTTLVADQTAPTSLMARSSYLFWLDDRGGGVFSARSASKFVPGVSLASVTGTTVRFLAVDPFSNRYWIGLVGNGVGASTIYGAFGGTSSVTPFHAGITGLGGLAADSQYVYWTQTDGRVYRAPTNELGGLGGP